MRSPQELEAIRQANRRAMGVAGFAGVDPLFAARAAVGMHDATSELLGVVGPITVGSAFPPFSYTYDPSQPSAPPSSSGGWLSQWITQSIVRPYANIGGNYVYNPGANAPDYSTVAMVGTGVLALGTLVGLGWILYRAFFGGSRRANTWRRRNVRPAPRARYYVLRRAA